MSPGQARGLRMACTLNNELFTKALIDNCGVGESELEELMAGFAELDVLRSLVIRRSVVGTGFLTYLAQTTLKIFRTSINCVKCFRMMYSKSYSHSCRNPSSEAQTNH